MPACNRIEKDSMESKRTFEWDAEMGETEGGGAREEEEELHGSARAHHDRGMVARWL